jgi:hypothetical protein
MKKIGKSIVARIKGRPYYAFLYAKNIIKERLPEELETVLSTDPQSMYLYAKYVMKGRLPEALHTAMMISSWDELQRESVRKYFDDFGSA